MNTHDSLVDQLAQVDQGILSWKDLTLQFLSKVPKNTSPIVVPIKTATDAVAPNY